MPPVLAEGEPEQSALAFRLYGFFRARPEGINVYRYRAGSEMAVALGEISDVDPYAVYDDDGTVLSTGQEDVVRTYHGGSTHTVDATEQALLVAAGYSVDP